MLVTAAATAITTALRAYDRDITVSQPTRCAVGSRLLIGERSKKGFKPLGYVDLFADSESGRFVATGDDGKPMMSMSFSSRSSVLSGVVTGAF